MLHSTAKVCSSNDQYLEESYKVVDKLLESNGYDKPRSFISYRSPKLVSNPRESVARDSNIAPSTENRAILSLPYISENVTNNIRRYIISHQLPIRVLFKPGVTIKSLLCSSRPQDRIKCVNNACMICPGFADDKDHCMIMGAVYLIICNICWLKYIGETARTLHERLGEHMQYANSPNCPSYKDKCLAKHYASCHPGMPADLSFVVLDRDMRTVFRKIKESFYIAKRKPELNDKEECKAIERFLV